MQRNTVQRQIIINALQRLKHPTVLEVNDEVQKDHPTISKTTIYRNLRQMDQEGLICQLWIKGDAERYDTNPALHYHFKCKDCGNIHDLELEYINEINQAAQQGHPHKIENHDIIFSGICQDCA
ncbi:MAG: transcriptional repressor [Defluviitaleaceae bacterium]|nr:transcriptional repressor [Defluviitaleaceae bacterium]